MTWIPLRLRRSVAARAKHRCEYCRLAQAGQEATFHTDHVVPRADAGVTSEENLALACVSCSLRKEARQFVFDPETKKLVPLFHPRKDRWADHFEWQGVHVVGLTRKGRGTVHALRLNRPRMLAIRREEMLLGRHPPGDE